MREIELSVVVPVYRCDDCLRALHARLTQTLRGLTDAYELIFVDDRSPDRDWDVLRDLARSDAHVRLVRLSRNFGQQAAITAGLAHTAGRWTVVMDCDLQDPPEEIPRLYAKAQEGHEIVIGRRSERPQPLLRRWLTRLYVALRSRITGVEFAGTHSNFSIISRKVVSSFLQVRDRHRAYLLILYWLGYDHVTIDFTPAPRYAGKSSYTFGALVRFAIEGVLFETTLLLRWVVYLGFAVSAAGVALAIFLLVYYFTANPFPGWTSISVLLLLIGGFIIVSTGVTGLYVGRVFEETKHRPLYVVDVVVEGAAGEAAEVGDVPDGSVQTSRAAVE